MKKTTTKLKLKNNWITRSKTEEKNFKNYN